MDVGGSKHQTFVNFCQTILRNNPEDSHLQIRRRENLKSHNVKCWSEKMKWSEHFGNLTAACAHQGCGATDYNYYHYYYYYYYYFEYLSLRGGNVKIDDEKCVHVRTGFIQLSVGPRAKFFEPCNEVPGATKVGCILTRWLWIFRAPRS
jgi:hypothetical protein